jgi:hypothetical protein
MSALFSLKHLEPYSTYPINGRVITGTIRLNTGTKIFSLEELLN